MPNPLGSLPHVLDDPPPFHSKLLDYGERPYWSPDGRRLAFRVSHHTDEAGYGRGLGLLDLAAWEALPEGQKWETAPVSEDPSQ